MSLRLYRLAQGCPDCGLRPLRRVTDDALRGYRLLPADRLIEQTMCYRLRGDRVVCKTQYWLRAYAWQKAEHTETLNIGGPAVDIQPQPQLSPRQAEVCALVVEGLTDRKIAARLGVKKPTVRKDIQAAAAALCSADGDSCRVFPRQTIVAYYRAQTRAVVALEPFRAAA